MKLGEWGAGGGLTGGAGPYLKGNERSLFPAVTMERGERAASSRCILATSHVSKLKLHTTIWTRVRMRMSNGYIRIQAARGKIQYFQTSLPVLGIGDGASLWLVRILILKIKNKRKNNECFECGEDDYASFFMTRLSFSFCTFPALTVVVNLSL